LSRILKTTRVDIEGYLKTYGSYLNEEFKQKLRNLIESVKMSHQFLHYLSLLSESLGRKKNQAAVEDYRLGIAEIADNLDFK
jgi:hypothetical protein